MGIVLRIILLLITIYSFLSATQLDNQLSLQLQNESKKVKDLYSLNKKKPLWIGHAKNYHALIDALNNPYYNYKNKLFYRDIINQYGYLLQDNMDLNQNARELATLDIALTKAYIDLAKFIVVSDVDWDMVQQKLKELKELQDIKAVWEMVRKKPPSAKRLYKALSKDDIVSLFNSLTPLPKRHSDLVDALEMYRSMPRDIPKISYTKNFQGLKLGDVDERITQIKRRLAIEGDYPKEEFYSDIFDEKLKYAIYRYKERFNLEQNGIIDKVTIYYMNKPVSLLIDSIITNLDKLKVFPNKFPDEYILVNIPAFTMEYYKDGVPILSMNAVVGRDKRPTPIFKSKMTYLELNPNWNIPENLVRKDLIPTLMEEPDYMKKHNIHVFSGWGKNSKEIKDIDINKLIPYLDEKKGHIPYRFVQFPGDDNALGRIKFMFPNKYSVYLHDTDNKSLFERRYRVYSSGCMRISKPFELLEALKPHLRPSDIAQIDKYRQTLKNKIMRFTKPLVVQTAYFTVFKKDDMVFFRKDIYGYDRMIQESVTQEDYIDIGDDITQEYSVF
jgi:murein L,D-transpeptidase YcbB/YkuD